jgi:hypothetical protein
MNNLTKKILYIFVAVLITMASAIAVAAEDVTITGTVNENYQIVEDSGTIYEVAENEKGNEVVELIGKKVQVVGTMMDADGVFIITVASYTIIEE